jgi:hypothetical protein
MPATALPAVTPRNTTAAFAGGAVIGALGGLIGLGGAEFRLLPLLIGMFRFPALQAVILNKAMSRRRCSAPAWSTVSPRSQVVETSPARNEKRLVDYVRAHLLPCLSGALSA